LLGTKELNAELQSKLNPKSQDKLEKQYGTITFREGDRVMQIKNNYDIYWEKGTSSNLRTYENGARNI
jgi:exodeoxyribonuclease V alpha subunit